MQQLAIASLILGSSWTLSAQDFGYNRDIRPILADQCFPCHGPDSAARQADLRLDQRPAAMEAGVLEPGDPDASEVIRRVESDDPDEVMPPPSSHKSLTEAQRAQLRAWIQAGAPYEAHWSLIPPRRPEVPQPKNGNWIRNPIDAFVLARLETAGLEPNPEADLATLVRRVSLDLTGLPPTPEELQEVLDESAPDRYERFVDRLLTKAQWGEHRARYWLDYARYADTHGIHFDNYREIWAYRDWVIAAFNANQPFDQFTIEQLAGDLLPQPTLDQQIATGFNRCHITTNEGGVIEEEYLVLYARDRVETTALVWLGLTAGCAVCHDHKYDSFSQREFYELAAFFNNTQQRAMDGNIQDTPPVVIVPRSGDRERWRQVLEEIQEVTAAQDSLRRKATVDFPEKLKDPEFRQGLIGETPSPDRLAFQALLADGGPGNLTYLHSGQVAQLSIETKDRWQAGWIGDRAWQVSRDAVPEFEDVGDWDRDQAFSVAAWVKLRSADQGGAVLARMDESQGHRGWDLWLQNGRFGTHLVHSWPGNALKVVSQKALPADSWHHLAMTYDGSSTAAGIQLYVDGQRVAQEIEKENLRDSIRTDKPFKIGMRHQSADSAGLLIQGLRIYLRPLARAEIDTIRTWERHQYLLKQPARDLAERELAELVDWHLSQQDPEFRDGQDRHAQWVEERKAIEQRGTKAHVMAEKSDPATAYVLHRGEYDQRREQVFPETPDVLPPFEPRFPRNRLGLAQWLVQPEHPLTSRVTVNRFWQEVFGQGLVVTSGDFGISGQLPSHPELLDYLAVSFREGGWNVKNFFREIVTSATYRQSATVSPEKLALDPRNELLSRGPRFRMDAEMVRDYALAASGLLHPEIGGPSVKPYQPPGVWEAVAMPESNTRFYKADENNGLYRRSMYTFWKRAAPPASLDILNAPNRETCTVRRDRTNTPLQALVTLNDPQFIEAARFLAGRLLGATEVAVADSGSDSGRLRRLGRTVLLRDFTDEEQTILQGSLHRLRSQFAAHPEAAHSLLSVGQAAKEPDLDPQEHASWTLLVNEVLNLDEVLNK